MSTSSKRIKLESSPSPSVIEVTPPNANSSTRSTIEEDAELDGEHCSICLQSITDRTVVPTCSHEFCFECLLIWTEQSRRCPLCSQNIGEYVIHQIRSKYDYQKHYLTPLRTSPKPRDATATARQIARRRAEIRREREWGRRQHREQEEADELERAIEKRRWVYRHHLYAKHVASNPYTRYRPFPTPAQFAASPNLISRATAFVRRELRVWVALDVEFLTTFTLSLMKSIDIRSEPAVRLLAEFLDMDSGGERVNAEHFAHELYSYLRSPYHDLAVYDTVVQYDIREDLPPPLSQERISRWRSRHREGSWSHPEILSRSSRSSSQDSEHPSGRHLSRRSSRSPLRSYYSDERSHSRMRNRRGNLVRSQPDRHEPMSEREQGPSRGYDHDGRHHGETGSGGEINPHRQDRFHEQLAVTGKTQAEVDIATPSTRNDDVADAKSNPKSSHSLANAAAVGLRMDTCTPNGLPRSETTLISFPAGLGGPGVSSSSSSASDQPSAGLPHGVNGLNVTESHTIDEARLRGTPRSCEQKTMSVGVRSHNLQASVHAYLNKNSTPSNPTPRQRGYMAGKSSGSGSSCSPHMLSGSSREQTNSMKTEMSPPAIMARWRARMAKHRQQRAPHSPGLGVVQMQSTEMWEDENSLSAAGISIEHDVLEHTGEDYDTASDVSNSLTPHVPSVNLDLATTDTPKSRSIVLSPFPTEQHKANEQRNDSYQIPSSVNNSQPLDSSIQTAVHMDVANDNNENHPPEEGVQPQTPAERVAQREAILRSQAQLRIRLAAAKKVAASQSITVQESTLESGSTARSDVTDMTSREELLKIKLAQRRR